MANTSLPSPLQVLWDGQFLSGQKESCSICSREYLVILSLRSYSKPSEETSHVSRQAVTESCTWQNNPKCLSILGLATLREKWENLLTVLLFSQRSTPIPTRLCSVRFRLGPLSLWLHTQQFRRSPSSTGLMLVYGLTLQPRSSPQLQMCAPKHALCLVVSDSLQPREL